MPDTPRAISLKLAEVERELQKRAEVYPRLVSSRAMRQAEAELHIAHMKAVLATLKWLQANEAEIRGLFGLDRKPQ